MARAPFQCLIIPYIKKEDKLFFAIFKRADLKIWQFISGGGEGNETPLETAKRECMEEANLSDVSFFKLDSSTSIPANIFEKHRKNWGEDVYVIPEYAFAIELKDEEIKLSDEHKKYLWVTFEKAIKLLRYDSNKTALTELYERIRKGKVN